MWRITSRRGLLALLGMSLVLIAGVGFLVWPSLAPAARAQTLEQPMVNMYSVKVVCVPELGKAAPALVAATYKTAVNILNPWPEPIRLTKRLTLSVPQRQRPIVGPAQEDKVAPWGAIDIDCVHMAREFGLQGVKVPGGKGFLLVQSDRPLEVAAVYTAKTQTATGGSGVSIDVEYIQARIVPAPPRLPDLRPVLPGPRTQVSCPTGAGSCTATFSFKVENIGAVGVSSTIAVMLEAEGVSPKVINITSGLAAGASLVFTETLGPPPGDNCYNPDCTVTVTVDPSNAIQESNEANNTAKRTDAG